MKKIERKNKKGVSVMIGYILLISMAVVMSIIAFQWLKTYVPKEGLSCPDGVSLFVKSSTCTANELEITLKNNGKFNVSGYVIRASTQPGQEVATTDLSRNITFGGTQYQSSSVIFKVSSENTFGPTSEAQHKYDISGITPYFIEIIPMRFETEDNKFRVAICSNQKIKEELSCS